MLLLLYDNNDHVHRVALDFDASSNEIVPLCNTIDNRIERFFQRIADIVNNQVLGTPENSTEWACATDDKKKEIGTITMDNMRTRAIMARLELLVEECIVDEDDKDKWLACIPKFWDGMKKLRSKEDFNSEAISAFQKDINEFYQLWVELWGLEGCTNYIHMMPSYVPCFSEKCPSC